MKPLGVVLHLTASQWGDVAAVNQWHLQRGFSGIGYHQLVLNGRPQSGMPYEPSLDGILQIGRPESVMGAHCKANGMNRHTLGVCSVGMPGIVPVGAEPAAADFTTSPYLTRRQAERLVESIARLCLAYGWDPEGTFKHPDTGRSVPVITQHSDHDSGKPDCASLNLKTIRSAVATRLQGLKDAPLPSSGLARGPGAAASEGFSHSPNDAELDEVDADVPLADLSRAIVTSDALASILNSSSGSHARSGVASAMAIDPLIAELRKYIDNPADLAEIQLRLAEAQRKLEQAERESRPGVLVSLEDPWISHLQSAITMHAAATGMLAPSPRADRAGAERAVKFSAGDAFGWVGSWLRKISNKNIAPWRTASEQPDRIAATTRLAVMGDWGTGMYGAPVCARTIQKDGGYGVVMHLGDVYYAGTREEVEERFLAHWPRLDTALHRALNSNHEMYSGGEGYFNMILPQFRQRASYFALQNDDWLLMGLDSAYIDHDFVPDQIAWLDRQIARAGNRKVVLFTHHQPFSILETQGPKLVSKLARHLSTGRIFAWYWGHEHRCVLYDRHPQWRMFGRCIGHGGMPYRREKNHPVATNPGAVGSTWQRLAARGIIPAGLMLDGKNPYIKGEEKEFGPNGFLELVLEGPRLTEVLRDPAGKVIYRGSPA